MVHNPQEIPITPIPIKPLQQTITTNIDKVIDSNLRVPIQPIKQNKIINNNSSISEFMEMPSYFTS